MAQSSKPSDIVGLSPDAVALGTGFLGEHFFNWPAAGPPTVSTALAAAWDAGGQTGRRVSTMTSAASAIAINQRTPVPDVPGARVQARPVHNGLG